MGRPRMIIVIRHAQSEGNLNRQIHQTVPDHRVRLTDEGWTQAREAGRRLRNLLRPSDTLRIYTSPYRRTRETTDGILETLTADDPEPSPFPRNTIKVWEEPRLREQDFGNFQPDSAEMERMWKARADYGHFFFRIPSGESAADAYDRGSSFLETLFRSFEQDDFPSVCVLVTHGLMTRVFLMRWYHWSVEYFEDLRNVNHCEMVIMKRSQGSKSFQLQTELRTWSKLRRQAAKTMAEGAVEKSSAALNATIATPMKRLWVSDGHDAVASGPSRDGSARGTKVASPVVKQAEEDEEAFPSLWSRAKPRIDEGGSQSATGTGLHRMHRPQRVPSYIRAGRDFGGSSSGAGTPVLGAGESVDAGRDDVKADLALDDEQDVDEQSIRGSVY